MARLVRLDTRPLAGHQRAVGGIPIDLRDVGRSRCVESVHQLLSCSRPTSTMKSGQEFHAKAEEAKRLLSRCVREHRNTPWAYLAQRELDYALGISVEQMALQPTGATPSVKPSLPRF